MNRSIEHELNVLFAEWESKMKANDNTSHFGHLYLRHLPLQRSAIVSIPREVHPLDWYN